MHPDWLRPDWPTPPGVYALCSTRAAGVSAPPFCELNLGDHVGDSAQAVAVNRQRLQNALGTLTPGARAVFLQQVHGTQVLHLPPGIADGAQADACISTTAGLACTILVADCLPVLLAHRHLPIVAAAHAGWRGLAGLQGVGVLERTVEQFLALAQDVNLAQPVRASDIMAWLGPCIGPQAFEVGPEVYAAFCDSNGAAAPYFRAATDRTERTESSVESEKSEKSEKSGHYYADLAALARQRLAALGIHAVYGNDSSAPWCTASNPARFFSHRWGSAHAGGSGRFAACVWLGAAP